MVLRIETEEKWASRVAGRLRVVYSSCADLPGDERQRFLDDELDYACEELVSLAANERKRYLSSLADRFPDWSSGRAEGEVTAARNIPIGSGAGNMTEMANAAMEQLLKAAPHLSDPARREIAAKLAEAGFAVEIDRNKQAEAPARTVGELWRSELEFPESEMESEQFGHMLATIREEMKTGPGRINLLRVLKLLRRTLLTIRELDDIAKQTWREISPDDPKLLMKSSGTPDLDVLLSEYFKRGGRYDSEAMLDSMNFTKGLLIAYIFALGEGGARFIRNFHRRFHPDQIKDYVRQESTHRSLMKREEVQCWNRYQQLMDGSTEAILERDLRLEIKESVAHAMRHFGAKTKLE